ncbi:MAG: 50S ribosomal protein L25/general stress protein Ctc [Deltaproteobacteria bacterium]|nr:50S ribosomal protein L25/general stress protein Ctc [Deltaproteobacteria bacterium]
MEVSELNVHVRNQSGKGHSRRLRIKGFIPAVFYGPKSESIQLAVNTSELIKLLKSKEENVFIKLLIDDGKNMEKLSMIKEIQTDPLTKRLLHADFYEIRMDKMITFDIPIHFIGEPVGIDNGGELHHLKRDVKVSCLPGKLPAFIEVDVSSLDIGDAIRVQDVKIDEGITILDPEDAPIATVSTTRVTREGEEAEGAETAAAKVDEEAKEE